MKIAAFLAALLLYSGTTFAQDQYTISGHVRDVSSGEELLGASIYIARIKAGTSSNDYGFYSLTVPAGAYSIRYSMVGFSARVDTITLTENVTWNVELSPELRLVDSIVVTAKGLDENVAQVEMGSFELKPLEVRDIPVIFGEQDITKTIQLMPGVKSANEGGSGFSVRGGGTDQNLILLDEATVYNASHLLGFFSVFNSDAIKNVTLIKGTASSEYGGRLSSVLDMRMKEGNCKRFTGSAGIGLVFSRVTLQAPIVKDKGSFIVSARRTYFDVFMKMSGDEEIENSKFYFYDLNVKANYRLDDNDRVFVSGYFGRDVFGFDDDFEVGWGNKTFTLRWNHIFSDRVFLNSSFILSKYDYMIGISFGMTDEWDEIQSSIGDVSLKEDFQYFVNPKHALKFGFNISYYDFFPGKMSVTKSSVINERTMQERHALENAVYLNHEYDATERLHLSYGVRYAGIGAYGPGVAYEFTSDGIPVDSTNYGVRKLIKYYGGLEPRLTLNYIINESSSAKLAYARNKQYMHLLSITTSSTPFDLWHPSTANVKPGISDQIALGYFRNFSDNKYEASLELYYKALQNQVEYRNGAVIFLNEYVESELIFGKGRSYGAELLIKKNRGRLTGWLGYTLSRTTRQFDAIDNGTTFPYRQDRTHELSIVGLYDIWDKWTFSSTWVYNSGNAVTFPSGKYEVDGHTVNMYSERNGYRMPAYHRLDLALTRRGKKSSWTFSLYNAYGRKNAFAINFRKNEADPTRTEAVRLALFSFFPSITYNYHW